MFWDKKSTRVATALTLGAFAIPGTAMAGIVVAASGPSAGQYPAGKKLDDATSISLKSGDSVTVLDSRGTRVLRGPGTVAVSAIGRPSRISVFNTLTQRNNAARVRTGAVRAGPSAINKVINPSMWNVDATASGTVCLIDPATVQVWRPDWKSDATYSIASADGAARSSVDFKAKENLSTWDVAKLPISDGKSFAIAAPGEAPARQVTFAILAQVPPSPEDLAATLIEKGCASQLELLTETLTVTKN